VDAPLRPDRDGGSVRSVERRTAPATGRVSHDETIDRLWKARPQNRVARASAFVFVALIGGSWILLAPRLPDIVGPEGLSRLKRFWERDVRPAPIRGQAWDSDAVAAWAGRL
jgi:hypothetical protein